MPGHAKAYERIDRRISEAAARGDMGNVDRHLDERHKVATQATEWDADCWGLEPDDWCASERAEIQRRA